MSLGEILKCYQVIRQAMDRLTAVHNFLSACTEARISAELLVEWDKFGKSLEAKFEDEDEYYPPPSGTPCQTPGNHNESYINYDPPLTIFKKKIPAEEYAQENYRVEASGTNTVVFWTTQPIELLHKGVTTLGEKYVSSVHIISVSVSRMKLSSH